MSEIVCNYSTIRFLPYRETGEFVNVGVIASCPEIGFFDFKIAPKRLRRVKGFFPELDRKVLALAIQTMDATLKSRRNNGELFADERPMDTGDTSKAMEEFRNLLRRRETLLHFADPGAVLTTDPRKTLVELYDRLVNRAFAKAPEYQEIVMQRRMAIWLQEWNLNKAYKRNQKVGSEVFHTVLPFVHFEGNKALRAIKPLDLNRQESTRIFDHGDAWVQRMRRLRSTSGMPERVVFAVNMPQAPSLKEAADEICENLTKGNVQVVPFEQSDRIHQLASLAS